MTAVGQVAMAAVGIAIAFAILMLISSLVEKKRRPPPEPGDDAPMPPAASPPAPSPPTIESPRAADAGDGCGSTIVIALVVVALVFGLCVISVASR
jgi:hypothetical protein